MKVQAELVADKKAHEDLNYNQLGLLTDLNKGLLTLPKSKRSRWSASSERAGAADDRTSQRLEVAA